MLVLVECRFQVQMNITLGPEFMCDCEQFVEYLQIAASNRPWLWRAKSGKSIMTGQYS
jgi:hypothetical protein